MTHAIYFPENISAHKTPTGHPETWTRLRAVMEGISRPSCGFLERRVAPETDLAAAMPLHDPDYLTGLAAPFADDEPMRALDGMDTFLDHDSLAAALAGVGAAHEAIADIAEGSLAHAFIATRPPGHHALADKAMGFCLLGTAALAAIHARDTYGYKVAVLDFDLHHGNGTEALLRDAENVFFASTQERNIWPGTSATGTSGKFGHLHNIDLKRRSGRAQMQEAWTDLLGRMRDFQPDLVIVSAGFDAHWDDPLSGLQWQTEDYGWLAAHIATEAKATAQGGILSILEGGYQHSVLRKAVPLYLEVMKAALDS